MSAQILLVIATMCGNSHDNIKYSNEAKTTCYRQVISCVVKAKGSKEDALQACMFNGALEGK